MLRQIAFIPQHQFHVLVNFKGDERVLAVLPNEAGEFRVVDQGKIIAEVNVNKDNNVVCSQGKLEDNIMLQLEYYIKSHYSYQQNFAI